MLVSAHEIAVEVCSQIDDHAQKHLHKVIRLVARAIKQLNLKYNPAIRAEMMEVSEALAIRLPEVALKPTKIGKPTDDFKRIETFELDSTLITDGMVEGCKCIEGVEASDCPVHTFFGCCWGGMMYGSVCISGSRRHIGKARWIPEQGAIYFDSQGVAVGDYVLVEYEVAGDDRAVMLPEVLMEAVIQRVLQWETQRLNPRASSYHHQQFRIEINEARRLMEVDSYEDLVMAMTKWTAPRRARVARPKPPVFITKQYTIVEPGNPQGIPGPYTDDSAALAAGLSVGDQYFVAADNPWFLPFGTVKVIGE